MVHIEVPDAGGYPAERKSLMDRVALKKRIDIREKFIGSRSPRSSVRTENRTKTKLRVRETIGGQKRATRLGKTIDY